MNWLGRLASGAILALVACGTEREGRVEERHTHAGQASLPGRQVGEEGARSVSLPEGALCAGTGGDWNASLRSCSCAERFIFSMERGCVDLLGVAQFSEGELILPEGLRLWFAPHVDVPAMIREGQISLAGYSFSEAADAGLLAVEDAAMEPLRVEAMLEAPSFPQSPLVVPHPLARGGARSEPLTVSEAVERCQALAPVASDGVHPWLGTCETLAGLMESLRRDRLPQLHWSDKRMGLGRKAIDYSVAAFPWQGSDVRLRFLGKGGSLVQRTLSLASEGLLVEVGLAPDGRLLGGRAITSVVTPSPAPGCLQQRSVYFARDFEPVTEKIDDKGLRSSLNEGIRHAIEAHGRGQYLRLPTDSAQPLNLPVRAMLWDRSVDMRIPALAQRFQPGVALELLDTNALETSAGREEQLANLAAMDASGLAEHGTLVAGILVADLPRVEAAVVNVYREDLVSPAKLRRWLRRRLLGERPRVVTISMTFSFEVPVCEDVFEPLFREFQDETLFVVAAGNYGEQESPDICPASMAWQHPNVLSVAGTDHAGQIHRHSNWGAKLAKVTGPFCVQTFKPLASPGAEPRLLTECGTSFSAPFVGNQALRLFAQEPRLTAPEVARALADRALSPRCVRGS